MIIKPLETKSNLPVFFRMAFLISLVTTGILLDKIFLDKSKYIPGVLGESQKKLTKQIQKSSLIKDAVKKAEDLGGAVMGEATSTLNKLASDAGSLVSTVIYENSIGKVVDQIDKLPKDQQEKIREQICR